MMLPVGRAGRLDASPSSPGIFAAWRALFQVHKHRGWLTNAPCSSRFISQSASLDKAGAIGRSRSRDPAPAKLWHAGPLASCVFWPGRGPDRAFPRTPFAIGGAVFGRQGPARPWPASREEEQVHACAWAGGICAGLLQAAPPPFLPLPKDTPGQVRLSLG